MRVTDDIDPLQVLDAVSGLSGTYPGFRDWYLSKVIPGLSAGTRMVFAEVSDSAITGVAIAKRADDELKLCTLWRDPDRSSAVTAPRLTGAVMQWLGTDRPVFTVPSDRLQRLRPVLSHFGMGGGVAVGELYRLGVGEFLFNGEARRLDFKRLASP